MYDHILEHDALDKQIVVQAPSADQAWNLCSQYLSAWVDETISDGEKKTTAIYRKSLVYQITDREPQLYTQVVALLHFWQGTDVTNLNLWLVIYHIV